MLHKALQFYLRGVSATLTKFTLRGFWLLLPSITKKATPASFHVNGHIMFRSKVLEKWLKCCSDIRRARKTELFSVLVNFLQHFFRRTDVECHNISRFGLTNLSLSHWLLLMLRHGLPLNLIQLIYIVMTLLKEKTKSNKKRLA